MLVPLTGTLPGWPAAEMPTVAQSLLVIVGIPVLVGLVITVLVFAGQLARRGRGEQTTISEQLWVGEQAAVESGQSAKELPSGSESDSSTGGSGVRW